MDPFSYHCFMFVFCYAALPVYYSLVITCWEQADLLVLSCVVFSCVFVTFLYGVPGQLYRFLFFAFFSTLLCFFLKKKNAHLLFSNIGKAIETSYYND